MNPTLLIGLDGATFSVLDPLMENGTMPFLKELVDGGARALLRSTPNPLTPPAWTSLMTGRSPGSHGIFDFIWAQQRETDHYFTLHSFRDIRCETIWSLVSRQGGTASTLNFPLMSPPPPISGLVVPGLVSWKHLRRNVHPQSLYGELKALPGFDAKTLAWDFDLEKKAAKGVPKEEYERWIRYHIDRERQWFEVGRHVMREHPTDLTAILFDGVDKLQHMGYRFLDPLCFPQEPSEWELRMRDLCTEYFREVDGFLRDLTALAGPEARVFLASDHGFGPSSEVLRINTWLQSEGYLTWRSLDGLDERERQSAQRLIDNHFVLLDWERTTAYARSTTSNGIYIQRAEDGSRSGVPPEQYEAFREGLIGKLREIRDPDSGQPVITEILKKEEAFPGENNEQAPDLTLVMRDHSFVSILKKTPIVCPRPEIEGTHYPDGVFIASGPGVRKHAVLDRLSILDVAPTLLYSLGLPVPCDLEGRLPVEVFAESYLLDHPARAGDATTPPDFDTQRDVEPSRDRQEEEEILKRLRALGYVE